MVEEAALRKVSKDWAPETRSAMLAHLRAAAAREELQGRYSNAAELAQAVDPTFRITPGTTNTVSGVWWYMRDILS